MRQRSRECVTLYLRIAVSCEPAGCIHAVTTAAAPLRLLGKHHVVSCRIRERRRRTVASPATAKHGMVTGVWSTNPLCALQILFVEHVSSLLRRGACACVRVNVCESLLSCAPTREHMRTDGKLAKFESLNPGCHYRRTHPRHTRWHRAP